MGFHEDLFPTDISFRSSGGPGFSTHIIEVDSGAEERVERFSQPRHKYNVAEAVKSHDQLSTLLDFYIARGGPANGFRYRDPSDFTTASNHRSAAAFGNHSIGTGDTVKTDFQLIKKYTSGPTIRTRNITKPVTGTVVVGFDGVNQASGWSVNTTTGIVTFTSPPGSGVDVTAGCTFDVPVRFAKELDDLLSIDYQAFDYGQINDVPLIELVDGGLVYDDFNTGGGSTIQMAADITITVGNGRSLNMVPSVDNLKAKLPDFTNLPLGGTYFYITNSGSFPVQITTNDGLTVVYTAAVAATAFTEIILGLNNTGVKLWYASA